MKTIGIIGGLGPETTATYYLALLKCLALANKEARPGILIWNIPLNFQLEREAIVEGSNLERLIPYLIEAAQRLEQGGAEFLVMPCNSLHIFIEEIRSVVAIPVLSIVEETVKDILHRDITAVGLLSTGITLNHQIYQKALSEKGICCIAPQQDEVELLGKIIHHLVTGNKNEQDIAYLQSVVTSFGKQGVHRVLLACTDLQLLFKGDTTHTHVDTFEVLVRAAAQYCQAVIPHS